MKRSELIRRLTQAGGCVLVCHEARHDLYLNPATGHTQPVPRHAEIDNALAQHIKKYLGLERWRRREAEHRAAAAGAAPPD